MTDIKLAGGIHMTPEAFDAFHRVSVEFRRALRESSIELAKQGSHSSPLINTDVVHEAIELAFRRTADSTKYLKGVEHKLDDESRVA